MSKQQCMAETTSSEFVEWQVHFQRELNEHEKIDHALARIAAEIRRSYAKNPRKVKDDDMLVTYKIKGSKSGRKSLRDMSLEEHVTTVKNFFFAAVPPKPSPEDD